jgi:glycosyltransferase involved in cell wall biosynthesis
VFALPLRENLFNKTRWPNKIGEYMACGRPTVVSDVGEVAEVVKNNGIGLVAEPGVEGFAQKIRILFTDDKLAEDMGARAREMACKKYSWAQLGAELERIYFQVLNSKDHLRKEI